MTVETSAHTEPPAMPCTSCWCDLIATERAPYIRQHRRVPVDVRSLRHRDPVKYAPPTLLAYVEHLEALLVGVGLLERIAAHFGIPIDGLMEHIQRQPRLMRGEDVRVGTLVYGTQFDGGRIYELHMWEVVEHWTERLRVEYADQLVIVGGHRPDETPDVCASCEGDAGPNPYEAPSGAYVLCAECHTIAAQEAADAQAE